MTVTTCYMERPASMPMAAPVGAVILGLGYGHACSSPSAQHRAAFANASGNAVKTWMAGIDRQVWLTTGHSARHLGRRST